MSLLDNLTDVLGGDILRAKGREELGRRARRHREQQPAGSLGVVEQVLHFVGNTLRNLDAAAEKIAVWLWSHGVDVHWVKHDPTEEKVDINQLHQNSLGAQVCKMIEEAKPISEILPYDEDMCLRNLPQAAIGMA